MEARFFGQPSRAARLSRAAAGLNTVESVQLRPPSVAHGVQAFIWAVVFFLFLWFGMRAVGVSQGTSFILALVLGVMIFLFVRIFGEEEIGPARGAARRRRLP